MCHEKKENSCAGAVIMLIVLMPCLGLNLYDCARKGLWWWFIASLLEFWVLGGVLFWMGIEKFNAVQRRRRAKKLPIGEGP